MSAIEILVVDDETGIRELLCDILEDEGYAVVAVENATQAREYRLKQKPALVLLDIWMPDFDGLTLLKEWAKTGQLTMPVIMMSGHATIDTAIEATRIGAVNFLEKPISLQKLLVSIKTALENEKNKKLGVQIPYASLSPIFTTFIDRIKALAVQPSNVFLTGEIGSDFNAFIPYLLPNNGPVIALNKLESLLSNPLDLLKKSENGLIYFDEIRLFQKPHQQALLFLHGQAGRYNVRLVFASSSSYVELIESGWDTAVLSILATVILEIPPLREYAEDIPYLAKKILTEVVAQQKLNQKQLDESAISALSAYNWPGNVEQLRLTLGYLALACKTEIITKNQVTHYLSQFGSLSAPASSEAVLDYEKPLKELRHELERDYFNYHIEAEKGNISRVALRVGLERTNLYRKMKQLGIK
jgi:two-component system nitrogen regulation response regulator NtrX